MRATAWLSVWQPVKKAVTWASANVTAGEGEPIQVHEAGACPEFATVLRVLRAPVFAGAGSGLPPPGLPRRRATQASEREDPSSFNE